MKTEIRASYNGTDYWLVVHWILQSTSSVPVEAVGLELDIRRKDIITICSCCDYKLIAISVSVTNEFWSLNNNQYH